MGGAFVQTQEDKKCKPFRWQPSDGTNCMHSSLTHVCSTYPSLNENKYRINPNIGREHLVSENHNSSIRINKIQVSMNFTWLETLPLEESWQ